MEKRLRYAAMTLVTVAVSVMTVVSCTRDATAPSIAHEASQREAFVPDRVQDLRDKYGWMGQYHTDALAFVNARLGEPKNKGGSRLDKCRVASAALKDFHKSFLKSGRALSYNDLSTIDGFCDAGANGDLKLVASVGISGTAAPRADISVAASGYMGQIESAFDADVSLGDLQSSIYQVESAAASTLAPDEAGAVSGLASIAISSSDYWNSNLDGWGGVSDGPGTAYNRSANASGILGSVVLTPGRAPSYSVGSRARAIMKADVMAALSTLLAEWWMGMIAFEKAAIRGAAASIVAGIFQT